MGRERFEISRLEVAEEEYVFFAGSNEAGERLDAVLAARFRWLSRSEAKKVIAAGSVFVTRGLAEGEAARSGPAGAFSRRAEERVVKGSFRLSLRDRVLLVWPRRPHDQDAARASPPEKEIEILFEDDCLIAVNKPAGMPVHPAGESVFRTVLFALHTRCRAAGVLRDKMPVLGHRLDVETSGVLLAVKGRAEARSVVEQFRKRQVRKEYLALVYGCPDPGAGAVDLRIGPDEDSDVPFKQAVRPDGSPSRTRWAVERRGRRFALVRLFPETGRKHQLRVHMAAIGHPVVGDKIYGSHEEYYFKALAGPLAPADLADLILPRHALHSSRLSLSHPRTGAEVSFEAPLPADMVHVLKEDSRGSEAGD